MPHERHVIPSLSCLDTTLTYTLKHIIGAYLLLIINSSCCEMRPPLTHIPNLASDCTARRRRRRVGRGRKSLILAVHRNVMHAPWMATVGPSGGRLLQKTLCERVGAWDICCRWEQTLFWHGTTQPRRNVAICYFHAIFFEFWPPPRTPLRRFVVALGIDCIRTT